MGETSYSLHDSLTDKFHLTTKIPDVTYLLFRIPDESLSWQLPKIAPPQYPSLNLIEMLTIGGGGVGTTLAIFPAISVFILPAASASRVADCAVCPSVSVRLPSLPRN